MIDLTHLSKLGVVLIDLSRKKPYKLNITLLLKIRLGNLYLFRKIDHLLLVNNILS